MLLIVSLFLLCVPLFIELIIEPTNVPRFVISSAVLIIAFIFSFKKDDGLPDGPIFFLILIFYCWSLITVIWGFNKADGIYEAQKITIVIGIVYWGWNFLKSENNLLLLAKVIGILSYFIALIFFIQKVFTVKGHIFGHENLLSSFLLIGLPFIIYLLRNEKSTWRYISLMALVLILTVLLMIRTRSVILGVSVGIVLFISAYLIRNLSLKVRGIIIALSFGLIMLVSAIAVKSLFHSANSHEKASLMERTALWKKSIQLIQEEPIIGVGTGNWAYNYSKFSVNDIEKSYFYNSFFKRPHNDFLWIASENGLIGLGIVLVIIGIVAWKGLREYFTRKNLDLLIFLSGGLGLLVVACFSFPKERISHLIMASLLLVTILRRISLKDAVPSFNKGLVLLFILLFGANIWIGWKRLQGEYFTKKAVLAQQEINSIEAIQNATRALSYFYTNDPSGTPIYAYQAWGYHQQTDLTNLNTACAKAYQISPFDYKVLSNYGYAKMRLGLFKTARILLEEAYRINSNYEPTILNLSVLAFNEGNFDLSLLWLQKISDYENKYANNLRRIQEKLDQN